MCGRLISVFGLFSLILLSACSGEQRLTDDDLDRLSERLIVCDPPYMRHADGCCLDQDGDAICDTDKAPVESAAEGDGEKIVEELCEQRNVLRLGYLPVEAAFTACDGNVITFAKVSLHVVEIEPGRFVFELGGFRYTQTTMGEPQAYNTLDGGVEISFRSIRDGLGVVNVLGTAR